MNKSKLYLFPICVSIVSIILCAIIGVVLYQLSTAPSVPVQIDFSGTYNELPDLYLVFENPEVGYKKEQILTKNGGQVVEINMDKSYFQYISLLNGEKEITLLDYGKQKTTNKIEATGHPAKISFNITIHSDGNIDAVCHVEKGFSFLAPILLIGIFLVNMALWFEPLHTY